MAWQMFALWAVATLGSYLMGRWRTDRPRSEDPRKRYEPRAAGFGEVLPVAFGTTLLPAPAFQRGRLVADKTTWTQAALVLGLCQGPISEVVEMWLAGGGGTADQGDGAQRVTWARMVECGAALQAGNLTGHVATEPTFVRGSEWLVAEGTSLRIVDRVFVRIYAPTFDLEALAWDALAPPCTIEVERATAQAGTYLPLLSLYVTSQVAANMVYRGNGIHYIGVWDVDAPELQWYRARRVDEGVPGDWTDPVQGVFFPATESFVPIVPAGPIVLHDFRVGMWDANDQLPPAGGALLDGTYTALDVTDHDITLDDPFAVNSAWNSISGTAGSPMSSPYWITGRGIYYPGIAHVRADPLDLAKLYKTLVPDSSLQPQFLATVKALLAADGPQGLDADVVDMVAAILGTAYWAVNLPVTVDGDHGSDGLEQSSARTYLGAAGFYASGVFDTQRSAAEQIQTVLDAVDCVVLDTEQTLKILPLGDEAVSANGFDFVPATTAVADLGPSDFMRSGGPAVSIVALPTDARCNVISVEYRDRFAAGAPYRISLARAYDGADIAEQAILTGGTGRREAAPAVLHWITNGDHARKIAQLRLQRALGVRNGQRFRAKAWHALVDCLDPLTLTDPHSGLNGHDVRVSAIEETEDGALSFETVDWPVGLASAVSYETQPVVAPGSPALDPGPSEMPFVAAVPRYLSGQEFAIWVAGLGLSTNYGGADVYTSLDGVAYRNRGAIAGRSPMGVLINALPSATGLDATNPLDVDLSSSLSQLAGTTDAGRDAAETLCWVDGELVSFRTVAAYDSGPYRWRLTSLRRGLYGTTPAAHAAGSQFVRLEEPHVVYATIPEEAFAGSIWVKFVPFSVRGDGRPDIASVLARQMTIAVPTVAPPTGVALDVTSSAPAAAANQWRASADELAHARWARVTWTMGGDLHDGFEVALYTGTDPDATEYHVVSLRLVPENVRDAVLAVSAGDAPLTVNAAVRAVYASGARSAWAPCAASDTVDADTNVAQQALVLAGSRTAVTYSASAPGSPGTNDLWFSTDTTTECPLGTSCAGTKNNDGTQRSPATHRGIYWPHLWSGSAWVDVERQALLIAAEIAAGAVVTDKLAANAITVDKLTVGGLGSDNLWPNPTSETAPPSGADTTTAEWAWRSSAAAYAGSYCRACLVANAESNMLSSARIPCVPGEQFHFEAYARLSNAADTCKAALAIQFWNAAGSLIATTYSSDVAGTTAWTKVTASATAGSTAVAVTFGLYVHEDDEGDGGTAYWDAMVARRKVGAGLLTVGSVVAENIAADAVKTSNFASTGSGTSEVATAGAKMQADGTSLLVAPGNFKIGSYPFNVLIQPLVGTNGDNETNFTGSETSKTIYLLHDMPDLPYGVWPLLTSATSGASAGSRTGSVSNRQVGSFTFTLGAAPGTSETVWWIFLVVHALP